MRQSDTSPCQCLQGTWLTDPGFECKPRALSVSLSSGRDSKRQNIAFAIMRAELTNVRIMKGWQPSHFSYYTPHSFFMPGILTPGRQTCMNGLAAWLGGRHSGFGWERAAPLPPSGCSALSLGRWCLGPIPLKLHQNPVAEWRTLPITPADGQGGEAGMW